MKWSKVEGSNVCCALSCSGDYVISHRPERFTVSYRPSGKHVPVGQFRTLEEAKRAAEKHQSES